MITARDLQEAIAECEGVKNPNANTCIKLAAFYTIRDNLFPGETKKAESNSYSYAQAPADVSAEYDSGSEFSDAAKGLDFAGVMAVMDELMETLRVINPRLYEGVLRRLNG